MGPGSPNGITFDIGSALPYLVQSVLGLLGRDAATLGWKDRLNELVRLSIQQASTVQCVGMPRPIPIGDIYQRTTVHPLSQRKPILINALIQIKHDAIIFAGPGAGKTTMLHWIYLTLLKSKEHLPLLFTLRVHQSIDNLTQLISQLHAGRAPAEKNRQIILLVDGYDEISENDRKRVSRALLLFSSLGLGNYYLTCRTHYDVYELKCRKLELGPFSRLDAEKFITAYSKAYGVKVDGAALVSELETHHLGEFFQHPLMLTLVCILKTSPNKEIPRRAIGLLRRAIETLAFRWDEAKGLHRESVIPLDGDERIRLLMRIAFDMPSPLEPWSVVEASANAHLRLLQMRGINVRGLLLEIARFYGLFVPAGEHGWQFAHRMIHDYLSAKYWVECGKFDPTEVQEWDIHAAYAASLHHDATEAMSLMLRREKHLDAFGECLYNRAQFDAWLVGKALVERLGGVDAATRISRPGTAVPIGQLLRVRTEDDIFQLCTDDFLRSLFKALPTIPDSVGRWNREEASRGALILAVCAMRELCRRKVRVKAKQFALFKTIGLSEQFSHYECIFPRRKLHYSIEDIELLVPTGGYRTVHSREPSASR